MLVPSTLIRGDPSGLMIPDISRSDRFREASSTRRVENPTTGSSVDSTLDLEVGRPDDQVPGTLGPFGFEIDVLAFLLAEE